jgi:hypothetical protein
MFDIKCPACGADGRIPKQKIDTRLVCRKCLKVFHVTPSGNSVLGEPASAFQGATAKPSDPASADPTLRLDQFFENAKEKLTNPINLAVAAGVLLLGAAVIYFSSQSQESLQDRVEKVAKAAVEGDLRTVREMAASGTDADVEAWYTSIRPQCDQLRLRPGSNKVAVFTVITRETPGQSADVLASINTEESLERRGKNLPDESIVVTTTSNQPVSLPMGWTSEGWSGWRLDGKRTQELVAASPKLPTVPTVPVVPTVPGG